MPLVRPCRRAGKRPQQVSPYIRCRRCRAFGTQTRCSFLFRRPALMVAAGEIQHLGVIVELTAAVFSRRRGRTGYAPLRWFRQSSGKSAAYSPVPQVRAHGGTPREWGVAGATDLAAAAQRAFQYVLCHQFVRFQLLFRKLPRKLYAAARIIPFRTASCACKRGRRLPRRSRPNGGNAQREQLFNLSRYFSSWPFLLYLALSPTTPGFMMLFGSSHFLICCASFSSRFPHVFLEVRAPQTSLGIGAAPSSRLFFIISSQAF